MNSSRSVFLSEWWWVIKFLLQKAPCFYVLKVTCFWYLLFIRVEYVIRKRFFFGISSSSITYHWKQNLETHFEKIFCMRFERSMDSCYLCQEYEEVKLGFASRHVISSVVSWFNFLVLYGFPLVQGNRLY